MWLHQDAIFAFSFINTYSEPRDQPLEIGSMFAVFIIGKKLHKVLPLVLKEGGQSGLILPLLSLSFISLQGPCVDP